MKNGLLCFTNGYKIYYISLISFKAINNKSHIKI